MSENIFDRPSDRGSHIERKARTDLEHAQVRELSEWCDIGHRAIAAEDWDLVEQVAVDKLLPRAAVGNDTLVNYSFQAGNSGLPWHPEALRTFIAEHGTEENTSKGSTPGVDALGSPFHTGDSPAFDTETLEQAFRSLYTVLVLNDVVDGDATSEVAAREYVHQVGVRYYRPTSSGNEEAQLIDPDGDLKATLLTGGQGSGKSTALETLVEDRVGRGHKVIDLIDFLKSENAMYDVPSQDSKLRNIREDMGLDVGFDEYDPPKVEVVAPLTPELVDMDVPYDMEEDRHVVRPFVIPASDLTYRQLVMLLPHTTKTQENYIQSAHRMLSKGGDEDWSLADLAAVVREETNASDSVADRIERALETAQNKSFIQDMEADHILDWGEMMAETDTITAFTAHTLSEPSDSKLIASYLLDRLYEERRRLLRSHQLHRFPPLTTVMRELHSVVPRQKSEQSSEKTIEGYMIDTMSDLIALIRHANMELICDTQKFKQQLDNSVSGLFHRVFCFGGQKPDIRKVFKTRVDDVRPASKVAQYETGKCALVSGDGYTMPIQMAPPRCHHLDARTDGDGLSARARFLDHEEMRPAPWDASIPNRLQFDGLPESPIATFMREYVKKTRNAKDFVLKDEITEAYHEWSDAADAEAKSHHTIHSYISSNFEYEGGQTTRHDRGDAQKTCYWGIELTW